MPQFKGQKTSEICPADRMMPGRCRHKSRFEVWAKRLLCRTKAGFPAVFAGGLSTHRPIACRRRVNPGGAVFARQQAVSLFVADYPLPLRVPLQRPT